ncbi:MAG: amidohydrolase family protein [Anaerolineae bacterium]|mgnify:CR=1 FL=1|nr:amidohydrolase family protein [Anaerolineae bacterium]
MTGLSFFDCNVSYGRPSVPSPRQAVGPDELLREMDWCGVGEALVTNAHQRHDDAVTGNRLVVEECAKRDRLHPAWVLMPHQTGEFPTPDELPAVLARDGVRALWAFPSRIRYLLDANTFGPTFEVLSALHVPLLLSLGESSGRLSGWDLVGALLSEYPRLTIVAADQDCWGQDRYFRPLVERYPNLYFDVADFELAGGYESYCSRYGPDRMLFATGFPGLCMGGPVLTLVHANIRAEDKAAIAGGNLRRLLSEVKL